MLCTFTGTIEYFLSPTISNTWNKAKKDCEDRGAVLPSVACAEILPRIAEHLPSGSNAYWLGGIPSSNGYQWLDGTVWSYTNWHNTEPNNGVNEVGTLGHRDGRWFDIGAGDNMDPHGKFMSVCQKGTPAITTCTATTTTTIATSTTITTSTAITNTTIATSTTITTSTAITTTPIATTTTITTSTAITNTTIETTTGIFTI